MERIISAPKKIKGKLITTVCMLLVAAVMLATTSYAWFALSTAPEVTGINTSIGANGALEIWLNDGGDIDSGNIVRLGAEYGLDQIILLPSVLNNTDGQLGDGYLLVPQYHADGYYDGVSQEGSASAGTLVGDNFFANDGTGVRGVGSASGMTPREAAYRNAKNAASTNAKLASTAAAGSLNKHGGALGTILVTKVANNYADSDVVYTLAQGYALYATVDALDKALGYIENAYEQMIVALAASGKVGPDIYATIRDNFADGTLTIAKIVEDDGITLEGATVPLDSAIMTILEKLTVTTNNVAAAKTACTTAGLPTAETEDTTEAYSWEQIEGIVSSLIVMENAELNGKKLTGSIDYNELAQSVLNGGVKITLKANSGVYADIAEHSGNFSANVTMTNVQAGTMTVASITANMATTSAPDPTYLNAVSAAVTAAGAPAGATVGDLPMTSFYGFIIDLGFRTNAQNSNLLLQTEATDRIYSDNEAGTETWGYGSYMTYKAVTNELTTDQVKGLMDCIRIVFFDTDDNTVIGEARLDTEKASISNDGVTAKMYMHKDGVLQNGGAGDTNNDASIVGLTKNEQTHISVLVYLDGATLENKDVAATDVQSVVGKMNLQFASDAELKPMIYGDLYSPTTPNTPNTPVDPDTPTVPEVPSEPSEGLEFTLNDDGVSYSVTGIGTCTDTDLVIPSTYNGLPVTSIGWHAFNSCTSLTSIVIPDSVTSISDYAFYYCSSLTSVKLPDSVTSIGYEAFRGCWSLTSIEIPDSVTSIGDYAFYYCSSLASIVIPDSVTSIGNGAFRDCSSLTSIVIPDSVTSIGDHAFQNCTRLTSIVIPDSITSIGEGAFAGCSSLTSIVIPDRVTSIGYEAFYYCSSLASIVIPDSVTSIGNGAFRDCSSLTSIVIPDSVKSIGSSAFLDCSSLESITVEQGNTVYHSAGNCLIETASKTLIAGCKNSVIPTDGSVTSIGERAFYGCSSLTSIVIPDSVTSIGGSAFSGCSSLTSIVIPDSVTSIGGYVFYGCSSLTSVKLPDSVTSIGGYVFYGCSSLTSVKLPDSVTSIGNFAFYDCSSLTSIVIPDSVTSIGDYAFYYCSSLASIVIPDSVTSIGYEAFRGCRSLTSVKLPNSVTSIDTGAFDSCSNLTSIVIPDGVTSIGERAFAYCSSLTSIVIPDSVTSIGDYAFRNCSSLTSITFTGTVEQWHAITTGADWNIDTGNYTIYCTDGTIAKDGTVTYY